MIRRVLVCLLCVAVLVCAIVFWWYQSTLPLDLGSGEKKQFVVAKGEGIRSIARRLQEQRVIRSKVAFFLLVKKIGIEKDIQAGTFKLSSSQTPLEIAKALTVGTEDRWITLIEGWRLEEILEYLQKEKIDEGNWTIEQQLPIWREDEGKFFPDTYLIPQLSTIDFVRKLLIRTHKQKVAERELKLPSGLLLTSRDVLILASLIEREVRTSQSRALVAGLLLNRLEIGMKLDVDATIQYALGKQKDGRWWKKELTFADLNIVSPFNTYKNSGLPPAPICEPSLDSIEAVLGYTENPYLFYLTDPQGRIHFAKTLSEHQKNISMYLNN